MKMMFTPLPTKVHSVTRVLSSINKVRCMNKSIMQTKDMSSIPPPEVLKKPPYIPEKMLFGPGPSNMAEPIKESLGNPLLGYLHSEFTKIMDDCKAGIQYLFQTKNKLTFAVSGTGHAGMECAIMNLLETGEKFLVVKNGLWGERAKNLGIRLGLDVKLLEVPEGQSVPLEQIKQAIEEFKPKVVFICHGESSTGVAHPLKGLGEICHQNDALLLVDTVASIGGAVFKADELGVDCVYSATQKVLNAPPGLAPISFSQRAVDKIKSRKTQVVSFYFDALEIGNYWGCFDEPRRYHHTGIMSLIYALREALALIAQEGLENVNQRHKNNSQFLYKKLNEIGLEPFVSDENIRLPCLTTIKVPEGCDWKAVVDKLMSQNIEITGGLGPTVGKIWRIGTFGINSNQEKIEGLIKALKKAIEDSKSKM